METKDLVANGIALIAAVAAMFSLWWANRTAKSGDRSADAAEKAANAAKEALQLSGSIFNDQKQLSQRQFLIQLWDYMTSVREIDTEKPATPQVLKAANTLELVALCCESGAVDAALIRRTFESNFRSLFIQIRSCPKLPGLNKNGAEVLQEYRAAQVLFGQLETENLARHKPTSLHE